MATTDASTPRASGGSDDDGGARSGGPWTPDSQPPGDAMTPVPMPQPPADICGNGCI